MLSSSTVIELIKILGNLIKNERDFENQYIEIFNFERWNQLNFHDFLKINKKTIKYFFIYLHTSLIILFQ